MSKAARIRALYAEGKTTAEIARVVFKTGNPSKSNLAYVRTAGRQRHDGSASAADLRYRSTNWPAIRAKMYLWRDRNPERWKAAQRRWYAKRVASATTANQIR